MSDYGDPPLNTYKVHDKGLRGGQVYHLHTIYNILHIIYRYYGVNYLTLDTNYFNKKTNVFEVIYLT